MRPIIKELVNEKRKMQLSVYGKDNTVNIKTCKLSNLFQAMSNSKRIYKKQVFQVLAI